MNDEQQTARVRVEALVPHLEAEARAWAERLGLPLDGEAGFALQLGDDGLQLVELGPARPARYGWISSKGLRRIGASSAAGQGR